MSRYNQWRLTNYGKTLMNQNVGTTPTPTSIKITKLVLGNGHQQGYDYANSNNIVSPKNEYTIQNINKTINNNNEHIVAMDFIVRNAEQTGPDNTFVSVIDQEYHADELAIFIQDDSGLEHMYAYATSVNVGEGELLTPFIPGEDSSLINMTFKVYLSVSDTTKIEALYDYSKTLLTAENAADIFVTKDSITGTLENVNILGQQVNQHIQEINNLKIKDTELNNKFNNYTTNVSFNQLNQEVLQNKNNITNNSASIGNLRTNTQSNTTEISNIKDSIRDVVAHSEEYMKYNDYNSGGHNDYRGASAPSLGKESMIFLLRYLSGVSERLSGKMDIRDFAYIDDIATKKLLSSYNIENPINVTITKNQDEDNVSFYSYGELVNILMNTHNRVFDNLINLNYNEGVRIDITYETTTRNTETFYVSRGTNTYLVESLAKYIEDYYYVVNDVTKIVININDKVPANTLGTTPPIPYNSYNMKNSYITSQIRPPKVLGGLTSIMQIPEDFIMFTINRLNLFNNNSLHGITIDTPIATAVNEFSTYNAKDNEVFYKLISDINFIDNMVNITAMNTPTSETANTITVDTTFMNKLTDIVYDYYKNNIYTRGYLMPTKVFLKSILTKVLNHNSFSSKIFKNFLGDTSKIKRWYVVNDKVKPLYNINYGEGTLQFDNLSNNTETVDTNHMTTILSLLGFESR